MFVPFVSYQSAFGDRSDSREAWFATLFSHPMRCGMPIAFQRDLRLSLRNDEQVCGRCFIMVATSREPMTLPASFEFRLRFAHRLVEEMRETQGFVWTQEDLGTFLIEILEEEFGFDWSHPDAIESFKEYLVLAYVAAGHVLPKSQRTF